MTGRDVGAEYRYRSGVGAGRLMRKNGGVSGLATKHFGQPKPALCARHGDVVLVEQPKPMLGICIGHRIAIQGRNGVEYVGLSSSLAAWSI